MSCAAVSIIVVMILSQTQITLKQIVSSILRNTLIRQAQFLHKHLVILVIQLQAWQQRPYTITIHLLPPHIYYRRRQYLRTEKKVGEVNNLSINEHQTLTNI